LRDQGRLGARGGDAGKAAAGVRGIFEAIYSAGSCKKKNARKGELPRCRPWGRKGSMKCIQYTPAILVPSGTKLSIATGLRESCTLGHMV
jgi:hypothetical protein